MPKLNDTQTLLLGHAARHPAGSFFPLPKTHTKSDARVSKALPQLVMAELAIEREVYELGATCRTDGDQRFGLYITSAGLRAIGVEEDGEVAPDRGWPQALIPGTRERTTKAASVLALLQRPEGVTLDELIALTGWLPHTTRAALTGLRKKGHLITRDKRDGATCYKVAAA